MLLLAAKQFLNQLLWYIESHPSMIGKVLKPAYLPHKRDDSVSHKYVSIKHVSSVEYYY